MRTPPMTKLLGASLALLACMTLSGSARADGDLQTYKRISTVASTIPDNGDLNPYAVFVAPASSGIIQKGDVIVDNFNNGSNLQGTGGSIVLINPATRVDAPVRQAAAESQAMPGRYWPVDRARHAYLGLGDRRIDAEHRRHARPRKAPAVCWCSIPAAS